MAILRDVILGVAGEDGERPGRRFDENGMRVYDVEVLEVTIGDEAIAELLVQAQHAAVQQTLSLAAEQRRLDMVRQAEAVTQQVAEAKSATLQQAIALRTREGEQQQRYQLAELAAKLDLHERQQQALLAEQERLGAIHGAELGRRQATATLELTVQQQQLDRACASCRPRSWRWSRRRGRSRPT